MKYKLILTGGCLLMITVGYLFFAEFPKNQANNWQLASLKVATVSARILGSGTLHSENEAVLHFQTAGKLIYLPFKQGDHIAKGQTIAQLDPYPLQEALTEDLNTYRLTRDTFDQTQDNNKNNVLQGQQDYLLKTESTTGIGGDQKNNIINDMAKRIVDQNQANLDNSVIKVQLANYALQLATLSSPISGVITSEDVTVPDVNVTTLTSFTVADPNLPVFRADIAASDIAFVSQGAAAQIIFDGLPKQVFQATVTKIYPQKITLANGQEVYQVDLNSNDFQNSLLLGQAGRVLIQSNAQENAILVPTWAVINHNYLWVLENNQPVLKQVSIGKVLGTTTEIVQGLNAQDRVIADPKSIANRLYQIL